jgi:carbonyl reductase 1
MTSSRTAIVTGATQGLGLALVQGLAQRMRPRDLVLVTGRSDAHLKEAVAQISDATADVDTRILDVSDPAAIETTALALKDQRAGVDIVISNATARMTPQDSPESQIDQQIETNNLATTRMLRAFAPILKPGGRLLVVASSLGRLGHLDPRIRPLYDDARSLDDIDHVLESWRHAVHDGTAEEQGWPHWLNVPSKVAQVAAVRVVARQRQERDLAKGTFMASVCPGLIDTGASRPWFADMSDAQTPAQAAEAILDLALSTTVDRALYGELVQFGKVLPWDSDIEPESIREVHSAIS